MDTELARTFLAVVDTGNFISASDRLHVSQSTVSTRIHSLERELGCALFVRNKGGTHLTAAGRQFQRHATTLVRTIEQARHDVGISRGFNKTLVVGGRIGLWEEFLLRWLPQMQRNNPEIAIRADSALEPELMQGLIEGRIDIGVMYTPQSRPGLKVEQLFEERLVMVSSRRNALPEPGTDYIYVDWGREFYARHSTSFPNFTGQSLSVNIGWLALRHLLDIGGTAYLPLRIAQPHLATGALHQVSNAPSFFMPAYVVHAVDGDALCGDAIALMHSFAKMQDKPTAGLTRVGAITS